MGARPKRSFFHTCIKLGIHSICRFDLLGACRIIFPLHCPLCTPSLSIQKLLKNIQNRISSKDGKKVSPNSSMNQSDDNHNSSSSRGKGGMQSGTTNKKAVSGSNASSKNDTDDEKQGYTLEDLLTAEQSLREVQNPDERKALFIKKLKLCCIIFDFTVSDVDQNHQLAKEMKRTYLLELVEYISQSKHWFSEDCVPVILEMIGTNLFRSLPPPVYEDFDPEEDEPNFDPSWYVHTLYSLLYLVRIFALNALSVSRMPAIH